MTDANDLITRIAHDDEAAGSGNLTNGNIALLKLIFPQAITDGEVDFDVLRQLLGDAVGENEERYGLNWKGKRRARAFALTPSLGTLRPAKDDSVNWDDTRNILIEGDNLEVLKLLRRSYAGKVKLIYIDPPYNTGHDFVYPDNYRDSIGNYLVQTGQKDVDGALLTSDKEAGGRIHTDWLNMIYPRLILARDILADDGIILISIADEEIANLLTIMSEIFGEERRAAIMHRRKNRKPHNAGNTVSTSYEFIVAFYANQPFKLGQDFAAMKADDRGPYAIYPVIKGDKKLRTYEFPAGTPVENGQFRKGIIEAGRNANLNIEVLDEPEIRDGFLANPVRIRGRYCLTDENGMLSAAFAEQNIFINSNGFPKEKRRRNDDDRKIDNHHWDIESGRNEDGDDEIKALFDIKGDNELFKYPKPIALIRKAITAAAGPDSIIVDFFAGSGTTGHAVMAQNAADGGDRRFILVQLPEPLSPDKKDQKAAAHFLDGISKPRTIAELTKERLRRAGAKIRKDHPDTDTDTGFRVYKLSTSNLKPWQPDSEAMEASILDAVDNILPGRTQEDVLTELLIKTGIDLSLPQEKRIIAGQAVYMLGGGALFICLGEISTDSAEPLAQGMADWAMTLSAPQTAFYFRDSGLGTDGNRGATKANLAAILRQRLGQRIAKIASI